jgi:thioesterase domain-containing protein
LGGWSFGGLVAFEMAQQLTQRGETVDLLAILDTPAPCNQPAFFQGLKFLLGSALWSVIPFLQDYSALVSSKLPFALPGLDQWQWSTMARLIPEAQLQILAESAIRPLLRICIGNAQAAYRYVPRPYAQRLVLFKAIEQASTADPTLGWSALSSEVQLHFVPGNHLSLLQQPHVQELARQLRPYLAQNGFEPLPNR